MASDGQFQPPRFEPVEPESDTKIRHNGSPDRILMWSGGMDSTAMVYRMVEEVWGGNPWGPYDKRPVIVYLETTIGLSSQRLYCQMIADKFNWHLICHRTPENFDDHSREEGFYGNQKHGEMFNRVKGRQVSKLAAIAGNPHVYWGSRVAEKGEHVQRVEERDGVGWSHNPIYDWSDADVVEFLRDREIPFNPNWDAAHFTDCGCGATAAREELLELEAEGYEVFAQKLRELEDEVTTGDKRETWAWGSFDPNDQRMMDAQNDPEQAQLGDIVCGPNCSGRSKITGGRDDGG